MVASEILSDWRNEGGDQFADIITISYPFYGGLMQIVENVQGKG